MSRASRTVFCQLQACFFRKRKPTKSDVEDQLRGELVHVLELIEETSSLMLTSNPDLGMDNSLRDS